MNKRIEPISLADAFPQRRLHRASLTVFRSIRRASGAVRSAPGALSQAAEDVRLAWRESARPNV